MAGSVRIPIVSSFDPKGIDSAVSGLQRFRDEFNAASSGFEKVGVLGDAFVAVGASLTRNVTVPLVAAGAAVLKQFTDQEEAATKLRAVIKATGGEAGITFEQVDRLASAMQSQTTFADEAVMSNAALLLTFREVRNEVGYGNDVFNRAIMLSADLATLMGTDLQSATLMFGKALNDPVSGLTALRRAGVQLTDAQEDMIARFVESGRTLEAQKVILSEVERQFGGLAEEMAKTPTGQLKQAFNELGDASEDLGEELVPVLTQITNLVKQLTAALKTMDPETRQTVLQMLGFAAALGPVLLLLGSVLKTISATAAALGVLKGVLAGVAAFLGVSLGTLGLIIAGVIAQIIYFKYQWDRTVEALRNVGAAVRQLSITMTLAIAAALSSAREKIEEFGEIGKNIIHAMVSGVKSAARSLAEAAIAAVKAAIAAAKGALGISSPSRVFIEIGQDTMAGFVKGIQSMEPTMLGQMSSSMSFDSSGVAGGARGGITVNVSGAIDPEGTARTILRVLEDAQRRTGARL